MMGHIVQDRHALGASIVSPKRPLIVLLVPICGASVHGCLVSYLSELRQQNAWLS